MVSKLRIFTKIFCFFIEFLHNTIILLLYLLFINIKLTFLVLMGPIPEKPINTAECRKNLLDEIEDGYNNLEARINLFEAKTNGKF